jgi:hypothetical protein
MWRHGSSTALCSVRSVTTCRPRSALAAITPSSARLLDSVAPEVKTISSGAAPSSAATWARAVSMRRAAAKPKACAEPALPKVPASVRHSPITCATAASTGVVAA